MQAKNNFSSSVIFNINYLVEPNNCINTHTHTHTHTFARPLFNKERARNIQHKRLHTKGVHEVFS